MSKRVLATILCGLTMVLGASSPALADHEWGGGGYRDNDGRECRGGGCGNEREEDYSNGGCKYVCPQDSPITDSFNVCLPGATCYWDGRQGEGDPDGTERPAR